MTPWLEFTVPGNPRPKARPRVTSRGTYTPSQAAEDAFSMTALGARGYSRRLAGPVRLEVDFHMATARRVDIDNLTKLVMDACNVSLWEDDSQVADLRVTRAVDRESPRTVVRVWPLPDTAPGDTLSDSVAPPKSSKAGVLRRGEREAA